MRSRRLIVGSSLALICSRTCREAAGSVGISWFKSSPNNELANATSPLPFGFAIINHSGEVAFANSLFGELLNQDIPTDPAASRQVLEQISAKLDPTINLLDRIRESQEKQRPQEHKIAFGTRYYRFLFM